MIRESVGLKGLVVARLTTPKRNLLLPGPKTLLKQEVWSENLITQAGDQYYGDAFAGLHANATVTDPNPVTGMHLGTGATAAAKTGAGAANIAAGTYITGSNAVIGGTYPTSALNGSSRRITWQSVWAPGVATNSAIAEASIVTTVGLPNSAATEGETVSRTVFGATIDKQAGDTLTVTWYHDLLGA